MPSPKQWTAEETTYNEMCQRLGTWVCLHDESIHFPGWPIDKPTIKLCSRTLRVRANQAWKKLPREDQECMTAHELGHLEYQHYLKGFGTVRRLTSLMAGEPPKDELEADRYAVKLVGKERYLTFIKEQRDATPLDNNYALQLADFSHRIRALEER